MTSPRRVRFDFDDEAYARLERLRDETGSVSKAEVVRRALRVYEWLVGQAHQHRSIVVTSETGEQERAVDIDLII
jgi:hypothetical protein